VADSQILLDGAKMDIGVRAHCRRVATWSRELAGALGLSESERTLVERAALSHHVPEIVLDDHARIHLLADIGLEESGDQSLLDEDARLILSMFRGRREVSDPSIAKLIAVLEMSDDFDQFFEAEPLFESEEPDECANSSVQTMMSYLQVTSRADVSRVIDRLPIFPRAAKQVVKKVSDPEVSVDELESVASLDPVLTGRLIQTANSAYYSPARPIGSIQHAIAYIGVDVTRKVLLASTIRGNFASMRLHQLWNHSLDVAQAAEELTRYSATKMDPSEAFLAGLVHDIGRLAFSIMPARYLERFYRLTDGGCPPVQVELCLSGRSHAEVGAETLVQWKFPEWAVEAIRCHHSPERSSSPLASLLYIAEFVADSDEDLPSFTRLKSACRLAGIDADAIAQIDGKDRDILDGLRFAA
jgi:putative nucleotidyltransferase with HDIG domain